MSDAFDIVPGAALVHSAGDVLATIFDSLDTLVAYMDRDFNIIRVNRAFATASGHAPEDLVGRNCFALFPNPPAEAAFRRAVQSGDPYAAYAMPCFFGDEPGRETSCWDWHLRPVKDESGRVAAVVLALNDVTEWHRTELALEESEEQFRAISTAAQDAVLMADDEGRIAYWNPAAERLFGFRAEEVLGQPLSRVLVPERHVAAHERGYAAFRVAGTGKMIGRTMELEARRRDGSELPVEISVSAVKRKGHWHAVAILRDIAERRRLEADLRKNEALFRHLAEASPVGIFRTDANGDCTYVNERWSEIAGLEPAQAMGQGWVRALHPEDSAAVERSWYQAARAGRPFKAEYRFRRPDGKVTWVLGQAVRESGADGEDGYVGTITDITERKRAEQQMAETLRETERLYAAVSHEGWQAYRETSQLQAGYLFDRSLVRPADDVWEPEIVQALEQRTLVAARSEQRAVAVAPLAVRGETIGALGVHDDPAQPLSKDDLELIQAVSDQVALALESARLFDQNQRDAEREHTINRVTSRIRNARSVDEVLSIAAQELRTATRATRSVVEIAPAADQTAQRETSAS
jgi:PAS domain S-box-containing protein